jgi:predicted pyridoxine 5'-phosphate oxidase superfamily flavin-nucleotide-binding protein
VTRHYGDIAFTDSVGAVQERYGSRDFYARRARRRPGAGGPDPITPDVREYLAARDSFYLATVGETGWPYVQFRGGPPGFLQVLDDHTVGWAEFRGNLQYVSTGNLAHGGRSALIAMDYPTRNRLKIFGAARVVYPDDDPDLVRSVTVAGYDAVIERALVLTVEAFDWNCQQHIVERYSVLELQPLMAGLQARIAALEEENAGLRAARTNSRPVGSAGGGPSARRS